MKKIMIMMSAALLLSSCGLYNKYERPTVDSEGIIRDPLSPADTLAVAPQDTASFGNMPWRSVFTDPQLQQLIEQGLERNANLQNAALTIDGSQAGLPASHSDWRNIADGNDCHGAYQSIGRDEELFYSHFRLMDHRPLRQYPVAEALHPDEAPGL